MLKNSLGLRTVWAFIEMRTDSQKGGSGQHVNTQDNSKAEKNLR